MAVNSLNFEQVSTVLQSLATQATGAAVITPTDTGSFVSVANLTLNAGVDSVLNALSGVLSRTIFSRRPYFSKMAGLEKDLPKWGAYMRKLSIADKAWQDDAAYDYPALYDATEAVPSGDGEAIDPWTIRKPELMQTNFFGSSVYMDWISIFEDQLRTAFRGPEEFGSFLTLITGNMSDKLEQSKDVLKHGMITNLIGSLIKENNSDRVIHLLTEYNTITGLAGTEGELDDETVYLPENFGPFMKWVYSRIQQVSDEFTERSYKYQTVISSKKIYRHTPYQNQKLYMYSPARRQIDARVLADTFHDNALRYADVETVNFWQSIDTPDSISCFPTYTNTSGQVAHDGSNEVEQAGIFAVLFDEDCLGMATLDGRVIATPLNAKGLYSNMYTHAKNRIFMDNTEKAVVFLLD